MQISINSVYREVSTGTEEQYTLGMNLSWNQNA